MSGPSLLITGGSGYLGRELTRYYLERGTFERICILSRGEARQAEMAREFSVTDRQRLRFFIGDVRDYGRMLRAMREIDVVIHAAALKRVEVGEYNPIEMVRTNVDGAINVAEAAIEQGVARVIAVSSDKACEPLNCYGATKLVAEKVFLGANNTTPSGGTRFAVCRYGNVAGSTGSVIPTWRTLIDRQAAEGVRPTVPVTDPSCTRFWMTVEKAATMIDWTLENAEGGELVVPTLPSYTLGDLAEAMGADMRVLGLGQGEKVDETMVAPFESQRFRYVEPYLVAGGLAERRGNPIEFCRPRHMSAQELKQRLAELRL
ncbi:MAG TPA: SDR family NAD(P)-dependent oxidoreductase [Gemmatimonadales bacterium]